MRRNVRPTATFAMALLSASAVALAQPAPGLVNPVAPAAKADAPAPAGAVDVDAILDQLDQLGRTLQTFVADVELKEEDVTLAIESTRTGKLWYQKLPDGSVRMKVSFVERMDENNKRVDPIDFVLEGGRLIERQHVKKLEVRRQLVKPGEKVDPFKLGEGPIPLPIGQKKEEVKQQFDVKLAKPAKEDPPATAHLMLRPRAGTSLHRKFGLIDVWVDQKTNMPVRIETVDPKEEKVKSTTLKNVQMNPKLADADFQLPKIDETQWNVTIETLKE